MSIEIPSEMTVQECSAKEFIELMTKGSFSDDIHYVVTENLIYDASEKSPKQAIKLPAYLTVNGHISLINQSELKNFPKILIVNGSLNMKNCTGLVDLSSSKLEVTGPTMFNQCENMVSAPGELYVETSRTDFTHCNALSKFSNKFLLYILYFIDCNNLKEIPDDFTISSDFHVTYLWRSEPTQSSQSRQ